MQKIKYIIPAILLALALILPTFTAVFATQTELGRKPLRETAAEEGTELQTEVAAPEAYGPTPSRAQMKYYKDELAAFVHFSMSTFNGKEWSDGTDPAEIFQPTALDTDQWIKTFKDAGFKRTIITAKHHDGFNIYPTKVTDYSVKSTSWRDGKGDVLADMSRSCQKYGMDMGVYLSPWDQNLKSYPSDVGPDYNDTYIAQMKEIFAAYGGQDGTITEFWMDGANGSLSSRPKYDVQRWWDTLFSLNPDIVFQHNYGAPVRWVGNEQGYASEENWQTINKEYIWDLYTEKGQEDAGYLHVGAPYTGNSEDGKRNGNIWSIPEVDVSIRAGWFYKDSQKPKTAEDLAKIYFESVGRGSPLLLNVPPDKRGLLADEDVASLKGFREILDNTFAKDYAEGGAAVADSVRGESSQFAASNVSDGDYDTYWTMNDGQKTGSVTVELKEPATIDVIELQEYIPLGQRIKSFKTEVFTGGKWMEFGSGKTIGYKRLVKGSPILAEKIRVTVTDSLAVPLLNKIGAYKADARIAEKPKSVPGKIEAEKFDEKFGSVNAEKGKGENGSDNLGFIENGDYTVYKNVMFAKTPTEFTLSYGSENESPVITVRLDAPDGPVLSTVTAVPTGGYFTYRQATADVTYNGEELSGYHDLYLCLNKGLNIDWFEFIGENTLTLTPATQTVLSGDDAEIVIKRNGGNDSEPVTVWVETTPGTAVVDQCYEDLGKEVTIAAGESEARVTVKTKESHYDDNGDIYFNVEIKNPSANAVIGNQFVAKIVIKDKKPLPGKIQAVDYDVSGSSNLKKEQKGPDGGWNIGAIQNGTHALYKDLYFGRTPTQLKFCYTGNFSNTGGIAPEITFRLGGADGTILVKFTPASADGWETYVTADIAIAYDGEALSGMYDIYLELNAGINVAWFDFV